MLDRLIKEVILDNLPAEDVPQDDIPDVVQFLADKYGAPTVSSSGADREELCFDLPGQQLTLVRMVSTGGLVDAMFQAQVTAPCPTPGPIPVTLLATGTGTRNFTLSPGKATAAAMGVALATLAVSYRAQCGILCRQCPPPCQCQTYPAGLPRITITYFARWWGPIPIGGGVSVVAVISVGATCY